MGVVVAPISTLRRDVVEKLVYSEGDLVVTIPGGRARSLVVGPEVAAILEHFANPVDIDGAFERFEIEPVAAGVSRAEFEDAVQRLHQRGFLTSPKDDHGKEPWRENSQQAGYRILALIQSMDDTEVYQAVAPDGTVVALKVAREEGPGRVAAQLGREAGVLRKTPSAVTGELMHTATIDGRAVIALRWFDGVDVLARSNQIRQSAVRQPYPWNELRKLVVDVADAYVQLHATGVFHGDVHPKNILVGQDGVKLVDMALAGGPSIDAEGIKPPPERLGVPYFFEPEYAGALMSRAKVPPASYASDIYAVAALAFLLLSGQHYLPFRFDREQFFRQIIKEKPRSFASIGVDPWPELETTLRRGLEKLATARFPTMAALGDGLAAAERPALNVIEDSIASKEGAIARLSRTGADFDWPLPAPSASIHHGAAGIALALLQHSQMEASTSHLADAAVWSARARNYGRPQGYVSASAGIAPDAALSTSLHFGEFGVALTEALIGIAFDDAAAVRKALASVCLFAGADHNGQDLTSGKAGALLGCAFAVEALAAAPSGLADRSELLAIGQGLMDDLSIDRPTDGDSNPGVAHGVAGEVFAALRWLQATMGAGPMALRDRLSGLQKMIRSLPPQPGEHIINGSPAHRRFAASWCNGSTGLAHVFCTAHSVYGDADFLAIAISCADHAFACPSNGLSLCCGDAGVAYGQLAVYRATGEARFLQRAESLSMRTRAGSDARNSSLYKGQLGIDLLALQLEHPQDARMPLFEASGWPPNGRDPLAIYPAKAGV